jgi:anti-sigma factor RsiW
MRLRRLRRNNHDSLVCREFVEFVSDYLDDQLPPADRARFEAHLAECDGCSGYLQDIRRVVSTLHELPKPPADPATYEALLRAFRELRGPST